MSELNPIFVRRRQLGMSQSELASAIGLSQAGVSRIERGRHVDLRITIISKAAEALGLSVGELAERLVAWMSTRDEGGEAAA